VLVALPLLSTYGSVGFYMRGLQTYMVAIDESGGQNADSVWFKIISLDLVYAIGSMGTAD